MLLLKLLLAILLSVGLTACATAERPRIVDTACAQFSTISYAQLPAAVRSLPAPEQRDDGNRADTDATVAEVQAHNARYRATCAPP
jgi:hypothetical protein